MLQEPGYLAEERFEMGGVADLWEQTVQVCQHGLANGQARVLTEGQVRLQDVASHLVELDLEGDRGGDDVRGSLPRDGSVAEVGHFEDQRYELFGVELEVEEGQSFAKNGTPASHGLREDATVVPPRTHRRSL